MRDSQMGVILPSSSCTGSNSDLLELLVRAIVANRLQQKLQLQQFCPYKGPGSQNYQMSGSTQHRGICEETGLQTAAFICIWDVVRLVMTMTTMKMVRVNLPCSHQLCHKFLNPYMTPISISFAISFSISFSSIGG